MAHRRTQSARFPVMDSRASSLDSSLPPLSLAALSSLSSRKPKIYWYRTTFFALSALVIVSIYVLLVAQPSLSPIQRVDADAPHHIPGRLSSESFRLAALRHKTAAGSLGNESKQSTVGPQIQLDPAQELAAISSFLASLPQNVIPSSVDPSQPIDAQLVLDFDTRRSDAADEMQRVVDDVWARNPVLLYAKFYSPVSREIKQILSDMYLRPAPTIIDVDLRTDESVLTPLLFRLTSSSQLPILLIGGKPVTASIEEIRDLRRRGELQRMVTSAGAELYGAKKKQKKL
ncbi:uncharacterized protein FIBRA_00697 [Fibroporia radiculosa]|uniref:Uncharacterized protein n=1 Tax=Fibroporia radiculosa TaxID=599839 RepID=J4H0H9_9APHY|nr:uncharacterized protein FIBRA_00697 [Fibroporia radiculosa]CCL98694.1 predicted protein [Fibroporia radiculosa]